MCGSFLRRLVAEESWHSTPVGRLLLPVLLGFHLVLLAASGTGVYGDEQSEFVCHTQQPGCKAACYDAFHPLSPLRFWAFQVILVAVPSVLYMGCTMYHGIWHWEDSGKVKKEEETLVRQGHGSADASGAGRPRLLWAYVAQLGVRLVLEGAALGGQYHLYGFKMPSSFACRREPCLGSITCNLSRPTEKSIFLKTMFGVSGLCFSFTLLELALWTWRDGMSPWGTSSSSCHAFALEAQGTFSDTPTNLLGQPYSSKILCAPTVQEIGVTPDDLPSSEYSQVYGPCQPNDQTNCLPKNSDLRPRVPAVYAQGMNRERRKSGCAGCTLVRCTVAGMPCGPTRGKQNQRVRNQR
ncbi:gap junction gamma-3 protein [Pteronotus mesoamericanus]|uniref:gap junction gamma-3 protein n=1 Tax=Pteronotus mesoamericanus TaxID=1884717 RepID=UPI0023EB46F7|nr:gap junction gamma-3 protein [Pteronotus parnellii mesoamericanus]